MSKNDRAELERLQREIEAERAERKAAEQAAKDRAEFQRHLAEERKSAPKLKTGADTLKEALDKAAKDDGVRQELDAVSGGAGVVAGAALVSRFAAAEGLVRSDDTQAETAAPEFE